MPEIQKECAIVVLVSKKHMLEPNMSAGKDVCMPGRLFGAGGSGAQDCADTAGVLPLPKSGFCQWLWNTVSCASAGRGRASRASPLHSSPYRHGELGD